MFKKDFRKDGDRRSGPTEMHDAVCAECGNDCKVPFVPTGRRPVLCRDCFRASEEGGESRAPRERSREMPSSYDKESFQAECDTCGEDCYVPFKPIPGKPLYCQRCLGKANAGKSVDLSKSQFEILNAKMDKILSLLDSVGEEESNFDEKPQRSFGDKPFYEKKLTRGQVKRDKRMGR